MGSSTALASVRLVILAATVFVASAFLNPGVAWPQEQVPDMSGDYEFLSAGNTLGILEEEGKLKGYVDVVQGEDESDAVLTFQIMEGTRQGNRILFKTSKIHERYYRFTGAVEHGRGRTDHDADFLRLVGDLETVHVDAASGQEHVETKHETLKWKPKSAEDKDQ